MNHAINITHDGILKIRIPEGFRIEKVQVEEIGTEKAAVFALQKTGKWSGADGLYGCGIYICDNCGKFAMIKSDFCPNCGSYNGGD